MKKLLLLTIALTIISLNSFSQTKVQLIEKNGVFQIPCKINNLSTNFIFDTGASSITISLSFYNSSIANGTLRKTDLLPKVVNFEIANGDIIEGRLINIRSLEIGDLQLINVTATVIKSQSKDMLLGQTALQRFGSYTIDNANQKLIINSPSKEAGNNIQQDFITYAKEQGGREINKEDVKQTFGQNIKAANEGIEFCRNVEFEIYDIKIKNKEDGELVFEYDITNLSNKDFNRVPYGSINIVIEVITTDNRSYTDTKTLTEPIIKGSTIEGPAVSVKIRNKTPKYIFAYCTYLSRIVNKTYK